MDHRERLDALRAQMSNVCSMFALGMVMFDLTEESEILRLAVSSVGALGPYHAQDPYLVDDAGMHSSDGDDRLTAELIKLDGVDGAVEVPGVEWSWAFPMRAVSGHTGYLVVSADHEPSIDQRFLLTTLAQLTGAALVSAGLHRRDRTSTVELGDLNARLESTNGQLAAAVTDLQQRQRIHEVLTRVAAFGGGAAGIADAVYDLTGLAVAVEDRFGNLRAWAGPGRPAPTPRNPPPGGRRCSARARRAGGPRRPRPAGRRRPAPGRRRRGPGPHRSRRGRRQQELGAGARRHVLAMELALSCSLAETELRLGRDLVEDLLAGTDEESALARAEALGTT